MSDFLAPKFYPTWVLFFLMKTLSLLPFAVQGLLSFIFGASLYYLLPKRREIARINIGLCFPEKSNKEKKQLLKAHFYALGETLMAISNSFYLSKKRSDKVCKVKGEQYLAAAKAKNKPIILLTGHWSSMLFAGCVVSKCGQMADIFYPQNNALFDYMMQKKFAKKNIKMVSAHNARDILKTIKSGMPTWYAHDQDLGKERSVFAPFFGIETATIVGTAKLAKSSKASVLPVAFYTQDGQYVFEFSPALENYPSGDAIKDASQTNAVLEAQIRQRPEQYLWTHRRFKTRPNQEKTPYPKR